MPIWLFDTNTNFVVYSLIAIWVLFMIFKNNSIFDFDALKSISVKKWALF